MSYIKTAFLGLVALGAAGCADPKGSTREYVNTQAFCTEDTKKERSDFILSCIEAANPKSDEEPEDWIHVCQKMAEETLCSRVRVLRHEQCAYGDSLFGKCYRWRVIKETVLEDV